MSNRADTRNSNSPPRVRSAFNALTDHPAHSLILLSSLSRSVNRGPGAHQRVRIILRRPAIFFRDLTLPRWLFIDLVEYFTPALSINVNGSALRIAR